MIGASGAYLDGINWADADCHYGDHFWNGGGVCLNCGRRLRCYCGAFVREDGIEKHLERCRLVLVATARGESEQ